MLTIHFHRTDTIIGKAIRKQTKGSVNHVSVELGDFFTEADIEKGVVMTYKDFGDKTYIVESFTFEKGDLQKALDFASKQKGKKYDWLGILSFIWKYIPERKGAWYCSELAMVVLHKFLGISSRYYSQKQSPQSLLELCRYLKKLNI